MWLAALMSAFGNDVIFGHFRGFGLLVVGTDVEFHRHRRRRADVVSAGPSPSADRIAGWIPCNPRLQGSGSSGSFVVRQKD
jgi:hypothetical protein